MAQSFIKNIMILRIRCGQIANKIDEIKESYDHEKMMAIVAYAQETQQILSEIRRAHTYAKDSTIESPRELEDIVDKMRLIRRHFPKKPYVDRYNAMLESADKNKEQVSSLEQMAQSLPLPDMLDAVKTHYQKIHDTFRPDDYLDDRTARERIVYRKSNRKRGDPSQNPFLRDPETVPE